MSVSGASVTEATISSLMSSTTYSIEVAAVNSAGTGDYTDPVIVETRRSECCWTIRCINTYVPKTQCPTCLV